LTDRRVDERLCQSLVPDVSGNGNGASAIPFDLGNERVQRIGPPCRYDESLPS
jgi:hypothetical protein